MAQQKRPKSSRQKVAAHRQRLRKQGLRPIQIWVPDVRARLRRGGSPAIAGSRQERAREGGSGLH